MALVARGTMFPGSVALVLATLSGGAYAATPTVEQALKLTPVQTDVEYDTPNADVAARCSLKAEQIGELSGWAVRTPDGEMLRQFIDTDGDNVVDVWSYFRDGLEVYRDIDSDHNGKADQYRWLNTAGSRWGLDENEDGKIDSWKRISAEEVTAEVVAALVKRDAQRFERLLPSGDEIKGLGLSVAKAKSLREKVEAARSDFATLAARQKVVTKKTNWVQFGGTRPGIVPAGSEGAARDVLVYENVMAMIETDGQHGQLQVGTLVQVGDSWRLIDAPSFDDAGPSGFFFAVGPTTLPGGQAGPGGNDERMQELVARLEKLDQASAQARAPEEQAANAAARCDTLEQLAASVTNAEDKAQWIRSLAETLSAAVQSNAYPQGIERLKQLYEQLKQEAGNQDLAAYAEYRYLQADYNQKLMPEKADFEKIQKEWIESLEKFVDEYPNVPETSEALLQLGNTAEFAGEEDSAKKWYARVVAEFGSTPAAAKAAGAVRRLDCVGKVLRLQGPSLAGKRVDLDHLRGKVVLLQYWATWCEPCKQNMTEIKELLAKYGKDGFAVVSISLDNKKEEVSSYLKKHPLPWLHIYEPGGLDSRLANELGVLTLPTMMLLDKDGKVIHRNIDISEVDRELRGLLR